MRGHAQVLFSFFFLQMTPPTKDPLKVFDKHPFLFGEAVAFPSVRPQGSSFPLFSFDQNGSSGLFFFPSRRQVPRQASFSIRKLGASMRPLPFLFLIKLPLLYGFLPPLPSSGAKTRPRRVPFFGEYKRLFFLFDAEAP